MKYLFKSTTSITRRLQNHYWIDSSIVPEAIIDGVCLSDAVRTYIKIADAQGIKITANAIKDKTPMFVDDKDGVPKQIGYVVAGHTEIEGKLITLEIWIKINRVEDVNFDEEW